MRDSLQGKIAVVTGGSEGIGLASAKLLAARGATVFIVGRRQSALDAAIAGIERNLIAVQADVSKTKDLNRAFEAVRTSKGKIDILLINAGIQTKEMLGAITEEALDQQLSINFKGVIFTMQQALPLLVDGASVILMSSTTAAKGLPARTVYSATKAAVRSFARTWANELKDRHIRVNALSPGPIMTPAIQASLVDEAAKQSYKANVVSAVPLGRIGEPEEMGEIVVFLASDASSFINGADIQADGGFAQV
jgi:NAD(P)-dependent dehydrogenase (short-subunit alcohol dehydrogenase family)